MGGIFSNIRDNRFAIQKYTLETAIEKSKNTLQGHISNPEIVFGRILVAIPRKYHRYYNWIKEREQNSLGPKPLDEQELHIKKLFNELFSVFSAYMNANTERYNYNIRDRDFVDGQPFRVKRDVSGWYSESTFAMHHNLYSISWDIDIPPF